MSIGDINCGICGFKIHVDVDCPDKQHAKLKITSTCPNYQKIATELQEVDAYQEIFQPLHLGQVYGIVNKYSKHPSCPGIAGILKTIEVAADLALPQEASMKIQK